jgi:pilus assembly protein CpaF
MKQRIHQTLLDRVDLAKLRRLDDDRIREEIRVQLGQVLEEEDTALNESERRLLIEEVQHEVLGFGPLEPLLADPTIADILVNGHATVFVERKGRLERSPVRFHDDEHLMNIIERIASRVGRRVDESSPMVDARLPDGSRVNAIIPPLALDGPVLSIRKFSRTPLRMANLVALKSLPEVMARLLEAMVASKLNMIVSGGTGSGKTTLLNILSSYIPDRERIVTIEDAAELQLQQSHVVRLETRPPNLEGKGEINQRALVRNALRMRPDRIILGEVRGAEAMDMLQAMNTGHEGSFATIHANQPRDAIARIEAMLSMGEASGSLRSTRQQIASAITIIVQVSRLSDGQRKVVSLQEITGMEGDTVAMHEIWGFRQTGVDAKGQVQGYFAASGIRPRCLERLSSSGFSLADDLFDPSKRYA